MPTAALEIRLFCMVTKSLSTPAEPAVAPPIEIPKLLEAVPVVILQFLITFRVAPNPIPRLERSIDVGEDVLELVIVKLRSILPEVDPSMMTLSAPFSLIRPPARFPVTVVPAF